jgi:hypothetical protein
MAIIDPNVMKATLSEAGNDRELLEGSGHIPF